VLSATLTGPAMLAEAADDLKAVGKIADLTVIVSDEITVTDIVLAEPAAQVPGHGVHYARVVVDDEQGRPWQAGPVAHVSGRAHQQAGL